MVRKGDKVIMNGKYYVSEKNKDKEFIVNQPNQQRYGGIIIRLTCKDLEVVMRLMD